MVQHTESFKMNANAKTLSQTPAAIAKRAARAAKNAPAAPVCTALIVAGDLVQHVETEVIDAPAVLAIEYTNNIEPECIDVHAGETLSEEQTAELDDAAPAAPVLTYSARLIGALQARNADQYSKDNDISITAARKGARALDALYADEAWASVLDKVCTDAVIANKAHPRFIAVKALVKVVHACTGVGASMRSYFDPYSRTIIANLSTLAGITNKSALVCLSRSVTYDELDQQQALTRTYNCSAGTATTQASSTRMMLRALDVCAVIKGKKGDVTSTQENARCLQVLALFAGA
jgi:hypothetical protein